MTAMLFDPSAGESLAHAVLPDAVLAPATVEDSLALPSFFSVLGSLPHLCGLPFDHLPRPVQSQIVWRRLRQLHALTRLNPLWRERLDAAGVPAMLDSPAAWEAIPPTDKETFRTFYTGERPGLVVPITHGGFQVVASGGTSSGQPSETVYSLRELRETYALAGAFMGQHLMPPYLGTSGPRWVATTLADYQMWSSGTMVGGVLQAIPGINYIGAGPVSREVFHLMMSYPGPKAILGITQSIALLAAFAEGLGEEARASFRMALYGSGLLTHKVREDLKAAYPNLSILSYFAATQAETIGLQLDADSPLLATVPGLHLVEIVDEAGRSVAEGEEGELVVTRLHASEAPVLRYKVGDRAVRGPDRTGPALHTTQFTFAGRSGEFMHLGDTQYAARAALAGISAEFLSRGILDIDSCAVEVQFINNRHAKTLHLLVATPAAEALRPLVAARLGAEGSTPVILAGLIRSLSVFNSLEANEAAVRRTGYTFGLKLISPTSPDLVRTEVGKVPLLVDLV